MTAEAQIRVWQDDENPVTIKVDESLLGTDPICGWVDIKAQDICLTIFADRDGFNSDTEATKATLLDLRGQIDEALRLIETAEAAALNHSLDLEEFGEVVDES